MNYSIKITALKNGKNRLEVSDESGNIIGTHTSSHAYRFALVVRRKQEQDAWVLAYSQQQRPLTARENRFYDLLGYATVAPAF